MTGCSTYSSPPAARSSTGIRTTASSTDHRPLTSIRIRPSGPSASRTASSRACSSARLWPGSPTLTFAVRQPLLARTIAAARSASTAGTVTLTGTLVRSGAGQPTSAASRAARSHGAATAASYSRNGLNSPQPASPRSKDPLADRDPPEPGRQGDGEDRHPGLRHGRPGPGEGRAGPPLEGEPVGLAVRQQRQRVQAYDAARRPRAGQGVGHPAPCGVQGQVPDQQRDDRGAPLGIGHPDHLGLPHVRVLAEPGRHRRRGHVDAAGDHHVVDASVHPEQPVVVDPAEVLGDEPAALLHLRGEVGLPVVPGEDDGATDPDPPVGADLDRDPVERTPVVHAAAAGLAHPVRRHHPHPGALRPRAQGRLEPRAADQDGVEAAQGVASSSSRTSWVGTSET